MKDKIKKEAQYLSNKQKQLQVGHQDLIQAQHDLKRERLIVKNEAKKVNSLFLKFSELRQGPEVKEQLESIKVLLELILNDRNMMKPCDLPEVSVEQKQPELNQVVSMYQSKLEEMTAAFQNMQNMQNLQIMSQKMNDLQG